MQGHEIWTMDGGRDSLKPGRWKAWVNSVDIRTAEGHGLTQEDAVRDLKDQLREKFPRIFWYQALPVRQVGV